MIVKIFEKFTTDIKNTKDTIFVRAIDVACEKNDIFLVELFLNKGYDINTDEALYSSSYDDKVFRFMLEKGANVDDLKFQNRQCALLSVQMALIDYGHEDFIKENFGFNNELRKIPKYNDIIQRYEDTDKYNL